MGDRRPIIDLTLVLQGQMRVGIPIQLYSARTEVKPNPSNIHKVCGIKVNQRKFCQKCNCIITDEDIRTVVFTDNGIVDYDSDSVKEEGTEMEVMRVVPYAMTDLLPLSGQNSYYVTHDPKPNRSGGAVWFRPLYSLMAEGKLALLVKFVLRGEITYGILRIAEETDAMFLHCLAYYGELKDTDGLPELDPIKDEAAHRSRVATIRNVLRKIPSGNYPYSDLVNVRMEKFRKLIGAAKPEISPADKEIEKNLKASLKKAKK